MELQATLEEIILQTAADAGMRGSDQRDPPGKSFQERLVDERMDSKQEYAENPLVRQIQEVMAKLNVRARFAPSVQVTNGSYTITSYIDESDPNATKKPKVATVYTAGPAGMLSEKLKRVWRTKSLCDTLSTRQKFAIQNVNLCLQPGKTYLVLGGPGSGKSTLLKMIAGILPEDRDHEVGGTVLLDQNLHPKSNNVVWTNLVGYIDQIDRLHPFLTVQETCEFAFKCRSGGTHRTPFYGEGAEVDAEIQRMDELFLTVLWVLEGTGLTRVKDTFVGDQQTVRGVSGGEKKRVTVAEMSVGGSPVLCMDEISTGLDGTLYCGSYVCFSMLAALYFHMHSFSQNAIFFSYIQTAATTYDICKLVGEANTLQQRVKIISLLQPPPETFRLFDELILFSEGYVIYSGPVEQVVPHFESLGYSLPERMDVADWLQALPTKDGTQFLTTSKPQDATGDVPAPATSNLTSEVLSQKFYDSPSGKQILDKLNNKNEGEAQGDTTTSIQDDPAIMQWMNQRYHNTQFASLKLLVQREMLLWWRDKTQIKARIMQGTNILVLLSHMESI